MVNAEALPLCLDDKANENASVSQLHAFVEVKVITNIFCMIVDDYLREVAKNLNDIRYRSPNLVRYLVTKFCDNITPSSASASK